MEAQAVDVGGRVERVIEDADVHCPFAQVGGADEGYARWEGGVELEVCWLDCLMLWGEGMCEESIV